MLSFTNHQVNAYQNHTEKKKKTHTEIPARTCQDGYYQKKKRQYQGRCGEIGMQILQKQ